MVYSSKDRCMSTGIKLQMLASCRCSRGSYMLSSPTQAFRLLRCQVKKSDQKVIAGHVASCRFLSQSGG